MSAPCSDERKETEASEALGRGGGGKAGQALLTDIKFLFALFDLVVEGGGGGWGVSEGINSQSKQQARSNG